MPTRLAKLAVGLGLIGAAFGTSGCVLIGPDNGSIYSDQLGQYIGEIHAQSAGLHGDLVTLYRTGWNPDLARDMLAFGTSDYVLAVYRSKTGTVEQRTKATLADLRKASVQFGTTDSHWLNALGDGQWDDFHSALSEMASGGADRCLAVQITASGANWTTRAGTDSSCNLDQPPLFPAQEIEGNPGAQIWAGSCVKYDPAHRQILYKGTVIHTLRKSSAGWQVVGVDSVATDRRIFQPIPYNVDTSIWRFRGSDGYDEVTITGTRSSTTGFDDYVPSQVDPWNGLDGGMRANWWHNPDGWYFYSHMVRFDFNRDGQSDCIVVMPYGYPWSKSPADRPRK